MPLDALQSLRFHAPELMLVLTLVMVVLSDLLCKGLSADRRMGAFDITAIVALTGLTASAIFVFYPWPLGASTVNLFDAGGAIAEALRSPGYGAGLFTNMVALDSFGALLRVIFIATAILVIFLSVPSREMAAVHEGEFYALLVAVTVSMMWMANAVNLLMIYLALEMVSVGSYIMVGYLRTERLSNEAALKYLLFGAVSTGTMLYGMSLLYGLTGTLQLSEIQSALQTGATASGASGALLFIVILILAGIGFKTASVPFHFWCPDVYTGAPTPVTAFLSVGPKVAGFAVLVRFFFTGMAQASGPAGGDWRVVGPVNWPWVLMGVSVATMTLGNVAALLQTNLKRLLAYSSIAHAGYIMMGAVVLSGNGIQAMLVYMIIYLFMNLGAFLVVIIMHDSVGSFEIRDYVGAWRRSPLLTIAMAIFLLSLMGIPPFAGFLAKLYVFMAVVDAGLLWFAVVGALNSVIAVVYYVKIIKTMVIEEGGVNETSPLKCHPIYVGLLVVLLVPNVIGLLLLGNLDRITDFSLKMLHRM